MEKNQSERKTQSEWDKVCDLYDKLNAEGCAVRESKMPNGYIAAVADEKLFYEALGLDYDDETVELTQEDIDSLPPFLLFAYPGSGQTRSEAILNAIEARREGLASVETGRILHGSFQIGGGEMSAYMPSSDTQERCWTIEFVREGKVMFTEIVRMDYEPVFGPDVSDINNLNQRIEELIVEHELEEAVDE